MAMLEIVQKIIGEREHEITSARGFLGIKSGVRIRLKVQITREALSALFAATCAELGSPKYVHSHYGFIWEKESEALSYSLIEENYKCEVINFFILTAIPRGDRLTYNEYSEIVDTVKQILTERDLSFNGGDMFLYQDKTFGFIGENNDTMCLIFIKKHSIFFARSQKKPLGDGSAQIIPSYTKKKKLYVRNGATVKAALENCFV